ncbi:hypothetical protein FJ941_17430 [Mesorhizobium sp. B2-3-13]|uniref:hypothetical protein n=1 Tax=Mesorhizobium sp. B2-3-13 TaxID=2589951 RepID=UPI00112BBC93|nr:hypothetical protein [Mesorhizobium sp. B2-3-13]TPL80818.1 hypothetical protein FJ941_17430 [Mesorhizobium sp. B2-3-13]
MFLKKLGLCRHRGLNSPFGAMTGILKRACGFQNGPARSETSAHRPACLKRWEHGARPGPPASDRDRIMEGAARCATLIDTRWTFHNSGYASELELFTHSGTK